MRLPEAILQRVHLIWAAVQPFDGGQLASIRLYSEKQAGADGHIIQQYSTCSADAVFAAYVRACQTEVVAQKVAQQQSRLDRALIPLAIYGQSDCLVQWAGPFLLKVSAGCPPDRPCQHTICNYSRQMAAELRSGVNVAYRVNVLRRGGFGGSANGRRCWALAQKQSCCLCRLDRPFADAQEDEFCTLNRAFVVNATTAAAPHSA